MNTFSINAGTINTICSHRRHVIVSNLLSRLEKVNNRNSHHGTISAPIRYDHEIENDWVNVIVKMNGETQNQQLDMNEPKNTAVIVTNFKHKSTIETVKVNFLGQSNAEH
jgi:hypothetical protein